MRLLQPSLHLGLRRQRSKSAWWDMLGFIFFPCLSSNETTFPPSLCCTSTSFNSEFVSGYHKKSKELIVHTILENLYTSSTAQGGGGSSKNRKPIGEVGCCESGMAERSHCWCERWLISLSIFLSFSDYLPTYLPIYLCIYVSIESNESI